MTCPHCAAFHAETLPELKARYIDTGKVRLVLRDFPLDQNALKAAMIAHCAGPERQPQFVEVFFAQQASWARADDPVQALKQLAQLGGLGPAEVDACLADKALEDAVLQARLDGQEKYDIRSTPSFIIDGKTYAGDQSVDEVRRDHRPAARTVGFPAAPAAAMAGALPQHVASPPLEITRLRVSGFKSFSEPVELQLEAGLTGIVGPNGCGKSNIVEALRWAMGESSAKGLRGDGMEDVIFNGSATRPAHDVAEVRLKLRGRPEGLAGFAEEGELEVARRIGRGTGSTYRINGREARARDVQMLFADAGAGARSPAIISQGQIGFIVDSKPGDRRKLLEDAAGIGGLQARRREAELRLEATRANLQRVLDLLATQEARLAELAKQGRQAQRYRQLAAELRTTEAHLLLARHAEASRRATDANERVAALGAEHQRQEGAATASRQARADAAGGLPRLREAAAALQARATGLRERLTGLREAAGRDAAHLTALTRQRDEAAQDLQRTERMAAELAEAIRAAEGEAALLTSERQGGGAMPCAASARPTNGLRRHWRRRRRWCAAASPARPRRRPSTRPRASAWPSCGGGRLRPRRTSPPCRPSTSTATRPSGPSGRWRTASRHWRSPGPGSSSCRRR